MSIYKACQSEPVGSATAIAVEIVQPRRCVIEQTFGGISRCRRLARDHEAPSSSVLAFFALAAAMTLATRLAEAL